ncbi:hypothetical protein LO763_25855 [Glycomyces sp. A-F 0318]|uniref:hypothetical protein n=1 Tax=Glycomyces amatae TaxID=2881355 RepID=UPI001E3D8C11|nr:hypothetical protein [Glycomyces amatae]MCD0447047.1 hypothetical protein [Glycomyces amatae]
MSHTSKKNASTGPEPSKGREAFESAWTSRHDQARILSFDANRAADRFLRRTARNEPQITRAVKAVALRVDAALTGLEFRLKEEEAFKSKLADRLDAFDGDIDDTLADMRDALRYTFIWPACRYTAGVERSKATMRGADYDLARWRVAWTGPGYRGVNSFWHDRGLGQAFEVQFHTPESFSAKMRTHPIYERLRLLPQGDPRRTRLDREQERIFRRVPRPSGAECL